MPQIILASSSVHRRNLLDRLGLNYRWESPNIDETPLPEEESSLTAARLSKSKAVAVAAKHHQSVVIGSDQVASLHGIPFGKPFTKEVAKAQLRQASGQTMTFFTGLCVVGTSGEIMEGVVSTQVTFRSLSEQQISAYIEKEEPLDCAGSFKCEGLGIALFESIVSDDPTALIGLPLISLTGMLTTLGLDPLEPNISLSD